MLFFFHKTVKINYMDYFGVEEKPDNNKIHPLVTISENYKFFWQLVQKSVKLIDCCSHQAITVFHIFKDLKKSFHPQNMLCYSFGPRVSWGLLYSYSTCWNLSSKNGFPDWHVPIYLSFSSLHLTPTAAVWAPWVPFCIKIYSTPSSRFESIPIGFPSIELENFGKWQTNELWSKSSTTERNTKEGRQPGGAQGARSS